MTIYIISKCLPKIVFLQRKSTIRLAVDFSQWRTKFSCVLYSLVYDYELFSFNYFDFSNVNSVVPCNMYLQMPQLWPRICLLNKWLWSSTHVYIQRGKYMNPVSYKYDITWVNIYICMLINTINFIYLWIFHRAIRTTRVQIQFQRRNPAMNSPQKKQVQFIDALHQN